MVKRNTLKTKILGSFMAAFIALVSILVGNASATTCDVNGAVSCGDDPSSDFQVSIPEVLTVQIVPPSNWAVGNIGTFVRNTVTLNVISNNAAGFTASMTTDATTASDAALVNTFAGSSSVIPMLTTSWTRSDTSTTKFWGYSLDDSSETGTYSALALKNAAIPTTLIPSGTTNSVSKNIYFGAKADSTVDSGTYQGTVIISVVSGITE